MLRSPSLLLVARRGLGPLVRASLSALCTPPSAYCAYTELLGHSSPLSLSPAYVYSTPCKRASYRRPSTQPEGSLPAGWPLMPRPYLLLLFSLGDHKSAGSHAPLCPTCVARHVFSLVRGPGRMERGEVGSQGQPRRSQGGTEEWPTEKGEAETPPRVCDAGKVKRAFQLERVRLAATGTRSRWLGAPARHQSIRSSLM